MYVEKAAKTTFVQKICTKNVDEIDHCSQFHQHFKSSFCTKKILPKKSQSQAVTREKLRKTLLHKKRRT